jgi:ssDNA-binding Zn-finger/Zn-ribbon topoisomerase 1
MAYLNCPTCRLTVYSPTLSATTEECPRCRARLGKVSRLFRSAMPPRLLEATRAAKQGRGPKSDEQSPARA